MLQFFGQFQPARLEIGHLVLEATEFVGETGETLVVALVVSREPLVGEDDPVCELRQPPVDRRDLLLRVTQLGPGECR